jgi:hypothetical protein
MQTIKIDLRKFFKEEEAKTPRASKPTAHEENCEYHKRPQKSNLHALASESQNGKKKNWQASSPPESIVSKMAFS